MKIGAPRTTLALGLAFILGGIAPIALGQEETKDTPKPAVKPPKQAAEVGLKVGDAAPKIEVEKWVKGSPITKFETGQIYVVEYWATWCPPCKKSIPHITELQHQYKEKVKFIGVSIWEESHPVEEGTYLDRVQAFVKEWGEKMDYTVAFGGENAKMADTWMKPAGQNGIPAAFVVGKDGKILWIGHPMEMEKPLAEIVAGTYDAKAAADKSAKAQAAERKQRELSLKYQQAKQAGDDEAAGKAMDEMIELSPERLGQFAGVRFKEIFAGKGDKAAYSYAKKMSEGAVKDNAQGLNSLAWTMLDDEAITTRDFDLALTIAKRADEISNHKNAAILDTLARAYFEKKDVDKAIETETKAIKSLSEDEASMKDDMEEALKKYKAAGKN